MSSSYVFKTVFFTTHFMVEIDKIQNYTILPNFVIAADEIWLTGLSWVGYLYARRKNGSDEISGGNQIGSDTFQNGSDIIRYPTVILSPAPPMSLEIYSKNFIFQDLKTLVHEFFTTINCIIYHPCCHSEPSFLAKLSQ